MIAVNDLTLGCDPEFAIFRKGAPNEEIVNALRMKTNQELAGLFYGSPLRDMDPRWDLIPNRAWGKVIGYDGSNVEIRPDPTTTAGAMVRQIHSLLTLWSKTFAGEAVYGKAGASPGGRSVGGHIHLSWAGNLSTKSSHVSTALQYLDLMLGLPVALVCEPKDWWDRAFGGYGNLSGSRQQAHGLEYRTVPSWLVSPTWAARVLGLANAVHRDMVDQDKDGVELRAMHKRLREAWIVGTRQPPPDGPSNCDCNGCRRGVEVYCDEQEGGRTQKLEIFEDFVLPRWEEMMTRRSNLRLLLRPWVTAIRKRRFWPSDKDLLAAWQVPEFSLDGNVMVQRTADEAIKNAVKRTLEVVGSIQRPRPLYIGEEMRGFNGWLTKGMDKDDLFISPQHQTPDEISRACEAALRGTTNNVSNTL